ncbi:SPOR domain-containing protein [Azospirillum formosense]|nr:SPOR domain-containing protein [Azospirillum formosense]MBY3753952.1 SPOR domain-containing protein [Azospirillum formosense]
MADAPADDGGEARDDIARLLRALNDDLKADPAEEDDLLSPDAGRKAERHLPIGKIAAALAAAIGIGAVVVMLDQGGEAPSAPPAPLITAVPSAPAPGGASPGAGTPAKPEALITRAAPAPAPAPAPAQAPMQTQTQTIVAPAPTVATPPTALPQIPPPALKVPEPPVLPSPAPAAAKPADPVPAPHPVETAESAKTPAHPPVSAVAPPPAEPAKAPPPVKTAETAELQAMLSAPPPSAAPQRPAAATRPAPQPVKPALKTASIPPATAPSSGVLTPPALAAVPDGRYTVQVGSFQQADNAEGLVRRLRGLGFNAYALDWTDAEQRSWHVVRVGGYADTAAARQAAASLKGKVEAQPIVVSTR